MHNLSVALSILLLGLLLYVMIYWLGGLRNIMRQPARLLRLIRQYVWPHLPLEFAMVIIALGVKVVAYLDLVPSNSGHYHYVVDVMRVFSNGTTTAKTYTICGKETMEMATSLLSDSASTVSVTWDVTSTWFVPPSTTLTTPVA